MKDFNEVYEALIDNGYFTEEELALLTNINGNTLETLEDAIYCRYGFRSYEQMTEAE